MTNHVRTLLLNRPARAATPLGEYVPPGARELALPGYLKKVRAVLFGTRPDATMLDYRLRQYLTLLHATELAEFVTALDPRITYEPGGGDPADFDFTPAALPIGHDLPLFVLGDPPPARDGQMAYSWLVRTQAGDPPTVTVARRSPGMATASTPLAYTAGLADPIPLVGSGLSARFPEQGLAPGAAWTVTCLGRPEADPGQVVADLGAIGEDVLLGLFGVAPVEPYRTWKALWYSDQPLPYRLGAVLLAAAWRADEARGRT